MKSFITLYDFTESKRNKLKNEKAEILIDEDDKAEGKE